MVHEGYNFSENKKKSLTFQNHLNNRLEHGFLVYQDEVGDENEEKFFRSSKSNRSNVR